MLEPVLLIGLNLSMYDFEMSQGDRPVLEPETHRLEGERCTDRAIRLPDTLSPLL